MSTRHLIISVILMVALLSSAALASPPSLADIKAMASSPQPGDTVLVWVPGGFWTEPVTVDGVTWQNCTWPGQLVQRSDGTTLWIEPNFWNVANAISENYMRFDSGTDQVYFYVMLDNVTTQWGGIAWGTPGVVIAGRAPPQFAPLPSAGGYEWFSLPMKVQDFLNQYDKLYVKVSYEVVKREDTLVRTGLLMWFEDNSTGNALGEVYISFHDDFGGWVGDKTVVGTIDVPMIVDGELVTTTFEVQRALSGGGWAAMVFLLKDMNIMSGTVIVDLKPFVEEVYDQMVNFYGVSADVLTWSDTVFMTYFGSEGTSAELGWVLKDARILSPEEAPVIVTVTLTTTETTTKTETITTTETMTQVQTTTVTSTVTETTTKTSVETTTETVPTTDTTMLGIVGVIALIIGLIIGYVIKRK